MFFRKELTVKLYIDWLSIKISPSVQLKNLGIKENYIKKIFWPSSIAVFGPTSPKIGTPQNTILEPSTVYGISKMSGERWCEYYFLKYGVDVRSLRYPGIISYKSSPGGGTTDYAIEIFHSVIEKNSYDCFIEEDLQLPMIYMDDAIRATLELMNCDRKKLSINSLSTSFSI